MALFKHATPWNISLGRKIRKWLLMNIMKKLCRVKICWAQSRKEVQLLALTNGGEGKGQLRIQGLKLCNFIHFALIFIFRMVKIYLTGSFMPSFIRKRKMFLKTNKSETLLGIIENTLTRKLKQMIKLAKLSTMIVKRPVEIYNYFS